MKKSYIVIHHSTTKDNVTLKDFDAIRRYHMEINGWRDIGYHWVIEQVNGKLQAIPGRAESIMGAHCPGRNYDGIGVCCIGNFQEETPSEELYAFVAQVCRGIMLRHPIREIGGHRDYYATACPGKNFDMGKLKDYIKGGIEMGGKVPCTISIKGKEFPGYLQGGSSYFDGADVTDVIDALNSACTWDEKTKTVTVK